MTKQRQIVILGTGVIGATAAAYLGRMLPARLYKVIYHKSPADQVSEAFYGTLHADTRNFHKLLKINEAEFVKTCQGVFSLGENFTDKPKGNYLNTYSPYGLTVEGLSFVAAMQKIGDTGNLKNWEDCNLPAQMMRQHKFLPPDRNGRPVISDYSYGYQIDPKRYESLLLTQAKKFGAEIKEVDVLRLKYNAKGFGVLATNNEPVTEPYLIINCDNKNQVQNASKDWHSSAIEDLNYGIRVSDKTELQNHITHEVTPESASTTLSLQTQSLELSFSKQTTTPSLKLGVLKTPWHDNIINLGNNYGLLPVLGAPHRINQIALERLVNLFPTNETMRSERNEYNAVMKRVYSRFDDFQALWLSSSSFETQSPIQLSDDAMYKIKLFEARGRLPMLDEDKLFQDHWGAMLLGQGFWPKGTNLMAASLSEERIQAFRSEYGAIVTKAISQMPPTEDFIKQNCKTDMTKKDTSYVG